MEGSRTSDWAKSYRKSVPSGPCHLRGGVGGNTAHSGFPWEGLLHSVLLQFTFDGVTAILQEKFKGEMIHTSKFKSAIGNAGKRVLVVGAGTSGHDIAWEHVNNGAGEHLQEPKLIIGSESCLTIAEVVSGSNMIPARIL